MSSRDRNGLFAVKPKENKEANDGAGKGFMSGKLKLPKDPLTRGLWAMIILVILFAVIGIAVYGRMHLFEGYDMVRSVPREDAEGMQFELLGKTLIKYGHDGVFAQDLSGNTLWSNAYSMQTPMSSANGKTMVLYEQLGTHVYILNEGGIIGSYQVALPIRKGTVGRNGVAALILDDKSEMHIDLYTASGSQIASVKATPDETGYPLDAALSGNSEQLIVSYMAFENGRLTGKNVIYDFSAGGGKESDHIGASFSCPETVFPDVWFRENGESVAVGDNRFVVYSSGRKPVQKAEVALDKEIISCFYDDSSIGFIFPDTDTDNRYELASFSYRGRRQITSSFDFEYKDVIMDGGEILLCDSGNIYSYRRSGREKLAASYEKEVLYFRKLGGSRKYLVITPDSTDQISIR